MNLFIAIFLSTGSNTNVKTDECMWYFINLLVDTTLGVFICFALMLAVQKLSKQHNLKDLQSGLYFEKFVRNGKTMFRIKPKMYFIQLAVWVVIVIISKVSLLGFTKIFSYYLEIIGNFVIKPFKVTEEVELIMVLIIFPLFFNSIMFWVVDNILKLPPEDVKEITENGNIINGVDINKLQVENISIFEENKNSNQESEHIKTNIGNAINDVESPSNITLTCLDFTPADNKFDKIGDKSEESHEINTHKKEHIQIELKQQLGNSDNKNKSSLTYETENLDQDEPKLQKRKSQTDFNNKL